MTDTPEQAMSPEQYEFAKAALRFAYYWPRESDKEVNEECDDKDWVGFNGDGYYVTPAGAEAVREYEERNK